MINTKDFRVKSEIRSIDNIRDVPVIAIDGGYSSVKGVGPGRIFRFPSFAKRVPDSIEALGPLNPENIQIRDNLTGETWLVGETAECLIDKEDMESITDNSLYTRYRYNSDIFRIIMSAGIALGISDDIIDRDDIYLQTGLPSTYKERDEKKLISVLSGKYDISVKTGNSDFQNYVFNLDESHVKVMEQPQGTLCSVVYKDGEETEEGRKIIGSNTIILDVGFGTEDIFSMKNFYKNDHHTYSDTGMRAVFSNVLERLNREYPADFKIFEFQKYLNTGKAPYFDEEELKVHHIDFADILEEENEKLMLRSLNRLMQDYNGLMDYRYLIVTGGTGESRFKRIKEILKDRVPDLKVIPGNINTPELPLVYSNVYGYYMFRENRARSL